MSKYQRSPSPPGVEYLGGWDETSTRTSRRFRDRVLAAFRSPPNLRYLAGLFRRRLGPGPLRDFAVDTLTDSVYAFEQGEDLVYSDPIAQRGGSRPAAGVWPEVRRLNLAFYEYRVKFVVDKASLLEGRPGQPGDDDEPYHVRMFESDSLRPPGLEHLNGTGPLYGILEEQTYAPVPRVSPGVRRGVGWPRERVAPGGGGPPRYKSSSGDFTPRERFVSRGARTSTQPAPPDPWVLPPAKTPQKQVLPHFSSGNRFTHKNINPGVSSEDWGWDGGNPNRTPEQALEEYWGNGRVETSTLGATEFGGETHLQRFGEGDRWRENGGTRFMRYETIPIWQNLSRGRNYELDINGTLGTGMRETDNPVRRWNLDRVKNSRGEEYRTYGWRNSSTV